MNRSHNHKNENVSNKNILVVTQLKEFADDNLHIAKTMISLCNRLKKKCGKGRKCRLPAICPFPNVCQRLNSLPNDKKLNLVQTESICRRQNKCY